MENQVLTQIQDNLEAIKKISNDQEMMEFWSARDLMPVLGYVKWQKFIEVIEKAKEACKVGGQFLDDHFLSANEFLSAPTKTSKIFNISNKKEFLPEAVKTPEGRPRENIYLTRYACYLVAQNGDSRKPQTKEDEKYTD